MEIDQIPDNIWKDIIHGKINCEYEFLALKILLTRLLVSTKEDSSPQAYQKYVDELRNFFLKTQKIPVSQRDLQKILNEGGIL